MAGTSGKPLTQKPGLRPGFCIFVTGIAATYGDVVGELPQGVVADLAPPLDMVQLFVIAARELADKLEDCRAAIEDATLQLLQRRRPFSLAPLRPSWHVCSGNAGIAA
jgi:hypothetical protein